MSNTEWKSPVYNIIAVPFEKIVPNTYNPNAVAPPEMKRSSSMRGGATTHDERPLLARLASTMHVGTLDRRQNQSFYKAGLGQLFTVASSSGYLAELKEQIML